MFGGFELSQRVFPLSQGSKRCLDLVQVLLRIYSSRADGSVTVLGLRLRSAHVGKNYSGIWRCCSNSSHVQGPQAPAPPSHSVS